MFLKVLSYIKQIKVSIKENIKREYFNIPWVLVFNALVSEVKLYLGVH